MDKSQQDFYIKKMKDFIDILDGVCEMINQHDSNLKEEFVNVNKKLENESEENEKRWRSLKADIAEIRAIVLKKDDVVEKGDEQIQMLTSFEGMSTVRNFSADEINGAWQSIEQYLLKDLAPKNIAPYLEKLNIFTAEEWKTISVLRREKIAERILKKIKENIPDAFNNLLCVLHENKQDIIIDHLIKVIKHPSPPEINEPVPTMSSYTITINFPSGGNTVSEVERNIATVLKGVAIYFAFDLLSKVVQIWLGSVTIRLKPLSKHAKDTLEFFCKHDGMKNFVLDLLKRKDVFYCLPEGNICIQMKVCCYDGEATSEDGNLTDLTQRTEEISNTLESFEVLYEPQVIRQNLLFQFGYIVEEIEPLQFQDTFVGKGILEKKFFDQLKTIEGRKARALEFLNEVVNKDNTILLALVDALKNNGYKDLVCRLCFVAKQSQHNKDWVDDSFLEVVTIVPETCTEGELWSCYMEVSKRKSVDGDDKSMEVLGSDERKYPSSEDFAQKKTLIVSTEKTSTTDYYDCNHKHRGYALIFASQDVKRERKGAQEDEINMKELFSHLRFNVVCRQDVYGVDIIKILHEVLADEEYNTDSDCFVCVISAYGREIHLSEGKTYGREIQLSEGKTYGREIQLSEGKTYQLQLHHTNKTFIPLREIFQMVNDCKALKGKLKLFFIQVHEHETDWSSGRRNEGDSYDTDAGKNSATTKTDEDPKHIEAVKVEIILPAVPPNDTLMMYGVSTGYIAHRCSDGVVLDCSVMLKTLKDVLINIPEDKSLLAALTKVIGKVADDYEYEVDLTKKDQRKTIFHRLCPVITNKLRADFHFTKKYD